MKRTAQLFIALLFALLNYTLYSQVTVGETQIDTSTVISGLDTPWEIAWGPDDHIWFTERRGVLSKVDPANGEATLLLDITDGVYEVSEAGLLGLAFHPDFDETPWVYIVYNYQDPITSGVREQLVRYHYNGASLVDPDTLLTGLSGAGNHNGARLAFGPEGALYMTTGDVQNVSLAQDTTSLSGKVLRINPDGTIPSDNPDPGSYIWSIGHRNPQGLVFSPDGILYSSEHGPSNDDELNVIEKGRNYGWPNVQGFCDIASEIDYCEENNIREPLIAWTPTLAVAGIDYYNHSAIPEWQHSIIMATLKADRFVVMNLSEDGLSVVEENQYFQDWWGRLRDVCVSPDGGIFLAVSNKDGRGQVRDGDDRIVELKARTSPAGYCDDPLEMSICEGDSLFLEDGWRFASGIYRDTIHGVACDTVRITSLTVLPSPELNLPDTVEINEDESYTFTSLEGFTFYEWNDDPDLNQSDLTIAAGTLEPGEYTYILMVENVAGCVAVDSTLVVVSEITALKNSANENFRVYPNPVSNGSIYVEGSWVGDRIRVRLVNQLGQQIISETHPNTGRIELNIDSAPGLYLLETTDRSGTRMVRLMVN